MSLWNRLGLWPRMALVLTLGFLLLLGAFTALGEWALHGSEGQTRHEFLVIARLAASQEDSLIAGARSDLAQARDDLGPTPTAGDARRMLSEYAHRMGAMDLELAYLDPAGQVVVAIPQLPVGTDVASMPGVAAALASDTPQTSPPFATEPGGHPAVVITLPLAGGSAGKSGGVLVGVLSLDSPPLLAPLTSAVQVGRTGHASLLDAQGRVIVSTLGLPFLSSGGHPAFFQQVMQQRRAEVATVPFVLHGVPGESFGEQHLMAIALMQQMPWGVAIGGDASEAFAPVQHLRWGLAIIGAFALVTLWGGTLLGTRLLVRPVHDLMDAAQRIAAGDLELPLRAGQGGEIGEMAEALDQMRRRLLETIASLEDLSLTLDARVQEGTQALREQEAQTRQLLHRVISAQEEERRRIAYELHDEVGQTLTGVRLALDRLAPAASGGPPPERVERAKQLVNDAIGDLRRLISGLRPGALDQLGLMPALRDVAEQTLAPLDVAFTIEGDEEERLPPEMEVVLFRIAQEAMHNVARHSGARRASVVVARDGEEVTMRIQDDGRGFDAGAVPDAASGRGLGLAGMRERASVLGGSVTIDSAPGRGTTVEARVPLLTSTAAPSANDPPPGAGDDGSAADARPPA